MKQHYELACEGNKCLTCTEFQTVSFFANHNNSVICNLD